MTDSLPFGDCFGRIDVTYINCINSTLISNWHSRSRRNRQGKNRWIIHSTLMI